MHNDPNPPDDALEQALSRLYRAEDVPRAFETGWRASVRREEQSQMTKSSKKHSIGRILVPALAAVVLVAGSLWAGTLEDGRLTQDANQAAPMTTRVSASDSSSAKSAVKDTTAEWETAVSDDADYGVTSGAALSGTEGISDPATDGRKLVRTASLTLRTTAYDNDAERLTALIDELGGYVEDLYEYVDAETGGSRTLSLSLRVPQEKLDIFLNGVEGIGRLTNRSESTTDMTVQYADNEARLKTLYDKLSRLNELMAQAEDVSDLVEIEGAIADTQYQIDSYETAQRGIDRRVDMSAVNVTLIEETPAQSAANEDVSLGDRVRSALSASVRWLGQFLRNMLVFIVMTLPVVIPVALITLVVWLIVRRRRGKRSGEGRDQ